MSAPTPQPITDWLEKLGLEQYAERLPTTRFIAMRLVRCRTPISARRTASRLSHRISSIAAA
jgi:hypothetical protein